MNRVTSENIISLNPREIVVFGSNLRGSHHGGFASYAAKHLGAIIGCSEGIQGRTYAIPTKGFVKDTLPLNEIQRHVDNFILYAKNHPFGIYLVTKIGCGKAHLTPEEVAPLFKKAVYYDNIHLPEEFWEVLNKF